MQRKRKKDGAAGKRTDRGANKRPDRNLPFKALNEDFNEAAIPDTNTALGRVQGTPGEGTSFVEGAALHFLQRLFTESPELGKEITCLHPNMLKEQEMLEKGLEAEKEVEKEKARHRNKAPVIPVVDVDSSPQRRRRRR